MFSVCVQLVLQFVKPSGIVVSASLIVKRAISNTRRPLSLRVCVEVDVIPTSDILEALNYPRSRIIQVARALGLGTSRTNRFPR